MTKGGGIKNQRKGRVDTNRKRALMKGVITAVWFQQEIEPLILHHFLPNYPRNLCKFTLNKLLKLFNTIIIIIILNFYFYSVMKKFVLLDCKSKIRFKLSKDNGVSFFKYCLLNAQKLSHCISDPYWMIAKKTAWKE